MLLANTGKDIVATPLVVKQKQTEEPLTGIPAQHEHRAKAVRIQDRLMQEDDRPLPLLFRMIYPEVKRVFVGWALKASFFELGKHLFACRMVVELDEFDRAGHGFVLRDRKPLVGDERINVVILAKSDEYEGLLASEGDGKDVPSVCRG